MGLSFVLEVVLRLRCTKVECLLESEWLLDDHYATSWLCLSLLFVNVAPMPFPKPSLLGLGPGDRSRPTEAWVLVDGLINAKQERLIDRCEF